MGFQSKYQKMAWDVLVGGDKKFGSWNAGAKMGNLPNPLQIR